jgi:hypothetical protein
LRQEKGGENEEKIKECIMVWGEFCPSGIGFLVLPDGWIIVKSEEVFC